MPLPDNPTIYDILTSLGAYGEGGSEDLVRYFQNLLVESDYIDTELKYTGYERYIAERDEPDSQSDLYFPSWKGTEGDYDYMSALPENIADMDREDLEQLIDETFKEGAAIDFGGEDWKTKQIRNPEQDTDYWEYGDRMEDFDEPLTYDKYKDPKLINTSNILEGLLGIIGKDAGILPKIKSMAEKFNIPQKFSNIEKVGKRASSLASQAFMPEEILRRYKGLQGQGLSPEEDILAETDYLTSIGKGQRITGRKVKSIYDELSERIFGGIKDWQSNLG